MEDVRYLFCQFSKKDRNVNSYHCAIDIYGLNIQSFYKLFSSKTLHKYYGFSNEVLFSIFITTLYTGTSNINSANRRSICNEALTFEEFLKAICRVCVPIKRVLLYRLFLYSNLWWLIFFHPSMGAFF